MSEYSDYYERDGIKVNAAVKPVDDESGGQRQSNTAAPAAIDPVGEYLRAERRLEGHIEDMSKDELRLLRQVVRGFNRYIGLCLDMKED